MPDETDIFPDPIDFPTLVLKVVAVAVLTSAGVALLFELLHRIPTPKRTAIGSILAVVSGFYMGCSLLGERSVWSLQEDQGRFLLVLFPAVVIVELIAASTRQFRWIIWLLRLVICAGAAPVLLYHSAYVTDLAGPGSREWDIRQMWTVFSVLGGALVVIWGLLVALSRRVPGKSVPLAISFGCFCASAAIMMSGYASGGLIGFPLAAALAGSVLASFVRAEPIDRTGVLSLGTISLFALLVVGRFFGSLRVEHAILLFIGPLLCWLPELPSKVRGIGRVILAAVPAMVVLTVLLANVVGDRNGNQHSPKNATPSGVNSTEYSPQDYLDFGK